MPSPSRAQDLDLIIRDLVRQYGDRVPNERIVAEAVRAFDGLCASSRVDAFIPVLALRRAGDRLRLVAERVDAVAAFVEPGPGPRHQPGEVIDLVDGPFEVVDRRETPAGIEYVGRWIESA